MRRACCAWIGATSLLAATLAACGGGVDAEQLRRLEQRVAALEAREPAAPPTATAAGGTAADVRSLERRLAAVEEKLAAPAGGAAAAGGAVLDDPERRQEQRRSRRERLRQVTDEYRSRLAVIRQQQTDPAARQQAVREALQWYRESRRAVLAGEEPQAAGPP